MSEKTYSKPASKIKPIKQNEHHLQSQCISWFRKQYPRHALKIYAVQNERVCDYKTAAYLKKSGRTAGVADVNVDIARSGLHGVRIEFKVGKNKQTEHQKAFELAMRDEDYAYWLIKDFDSFRRNINYYLGEE